MMKKSPIPAVLSIVLLAALLGGCSLFPREEDTLAPPLIKPKATTYQTAKVTQETIENKLSGTGVFQTSKTYPVYFSQDGFRLQELKVQAGDLVKKGQVLAAANTGTLQTQIKMEQYKLQLAQLTLQADSAASDIQKQKDQIGVEMEQTTLDSLNQQLQAATLVSPIDGKVISVGDVKAGDTAGAYQTILTVGDTGALQLSVSVTGSTGSLAVGMKAEVTLANGDDQLTGQVASISAGSSSGGDSSPSGGSGCVVTLDKVPSGVAIGDSAQVDVILASKSNTLVIPKNAVQTYNDQNIVYVWDGKSKKECYVSTGIQSDTDVEILSGLSAGQNVILN